MCRVHHELVRGKSCIVVPPQFVGCLNYPLAARGRDTALRCDVKRLYHFLW